MKTRWVNPRVFLSLFLASTLWITTLWLLAFPSQVRGESVELGIAAQFANDVGITNHTAVIHATGFESENWYEEDFDSTSWLPHGLVRTTDPDAVFVGSGALEFQNREGTHDPDALQVYIEGQDIIYLRWYRKYQLGYDFSCQGKTSSISAHIPDDTSDPGDKPTGYDKYSNQLQVWSGGEPKFYTYHPDQPGDYGETLAQNVGERWYLQSGRWYSFEIMLKANNAGQRNGEIKLWIDGVLKGHYAGMRFRDTDDLKINKLSISGYIGGICTAPKDQRIWDDNWVLATEYIGPMVTEPVATPTPTSTNTPTPTATATSASTPTVTPTGVPLAQLTIDEPIYAGARVVTGNGKSGQTVVVRDATSALLLSVSTVDNSGRYAADLSEALQTIGQDGLEAHQLIQAEMGQEVYQTLVRALGGFRVCLPMVVKESRPPDPPEGR